MIAKATAELPWPVLTLAVAVAGWFRDLDPARRVPTQQYEPPAVDARIATRIAPIRREDEGNVMNRFHAGALAFGSVFAAQLTGAQSAPTPTHPRTMLWYIGLRKPAFTPPGPAFGAAWTALDALLGYAGYRLLAAPPSKKRNLALACWAINVLGVGGFSWVLFGKKRLGAATGVSGTMLASSIAATAAASSVDRPATYATVPLIVWLAFATVLQEEVWRRN